MFTKLATAIDENWPLALARLQNWVGINSFTSNISGCDEVASTMAAAFAELGLNVHWRDSNKAGRHFWAESAAAAKSPFSLLVGHHDTVFPPHTFTEFRKDEHNCYGPGVLDMKGGFTVMWLALAALAKVGVLAQTPLVVVSVSDEETGSVDGRSVIADLCKNAAQAFVFEAGRVNDAIVVNRKGTGKITVRAVGKAAHAGNDLAAGINAITALARFIVQAESLTASDGSVTVNVGTVIGGTSANTVPAEASCDIDLRITSPAAGAELMATFATIANTVSTATGATLTITGGVRRQPLVASPGSLALAARYGQLAQRCGLGYSLAPLVGGGSDANTVCEFGVPVIDGLGPRGRGFHTHQEYSELATFRQRALALAALLTNCEAS